VLAVQPALNGGSADHRLSALSWLDISLFRRRLRPESVPQRAVGGCLARQSHAYPKQRLAPASLAGSPVKQMAGTTPFRMLCNLRLSAGVLESHQ
jgi:hypothetical protein